MAEIIIVLLVPVTLAVLIVVSAKRNWKGRSLLNNHKNGEE